MGKWMTMNKIERNLKYIENDRTHENPDLFLLGGPGTSLGHLPVPPADLMQYGESESKHLESGKQDADGIRNALTGNGIAIREFRRVLDFGCSNSRILRHFVDEAKEADYVGCDVNANTVVWNIENLSPPFRYLVNTTHPSLPMQDRFFDFIYAASIFTHIDDLFFSWLNELARLLSSRGYAYLTFLDEQSVKFAQEHPDYPIGVKVRNNEGLFERFLSGQLRFLSIYRSTRSMAFIRRDFLLDQVGGIFDVVDILENTIGGHQTALLLKSKSDN